MEYSTMKVVGTDDESIREAAATIRMGGVIVYPTETFYGLGCEPSDPDATMRICRIKERAENPLPLICSDIGSARLVVEFNPVAEKLAKRFWPGPLTLVLPSKVTYPMWVTHGKNTLGIRVSSNRTAQRIASLSGGVIVSTSANKSGKSPHNNARDVIQELGREVDIVVDGGYTPGGESSTVLDLSGEELWIIRSGPIKGSDIIKAIKG
jgi:L-threonylcarbamoyladenylate synthase